MKLWTKTLIIIGSLALVGALTVIAIGILMGYKESNNAVMESVTIDDEFDMLICEDLADCITIKVASDGICRVDFFERKSYSYKICVKNRTLSIEGENEEKWYKNLNLFGAHTPITVYLPSAALKELHVDSSENDVNVTSDIFLEKAEIETDSGKVSYYAYTEKELIIDTESGDTVIDGATTESISVESESGKIVIKNVKSDGNISLMSDSGNITLENVECENISLLSDSGDMLLNSTVCFDKITVLSESGSVDLNSCDAGSLKITTDSGDVFGRLLSEKVIFAKSSSGKVDFPKLTSGGKCEINTKSGNIKIVIGESN